jgi:hypothetical protein
MQMFYRFNMISNSSNTNLPLFPNIDFNKETRPVEGYNGLHDGESTDEITFGEDKQNYIIRDTTWEIDEKKEQGTYKVRISGEINGEPIDPVEIKGTVTLGSGNKKDLIDKLRNGISADNADVTGKINTYISKLNKEGPDSVKDSNNFGGTRSEEDPHIYVHHYQHLNAKSDTYGAALFRSLANSSIVNSARKVFSSFFHKR